MAKKKFNLTEQYGNVEQPVEKKPKVSKYSHFLENEIVNPQDESTPAIATTPVDVDDAKVKNSIRINMGFSDSNYEFLQNESYRLNINITHLVNTLIRIIDVSDMDAYIETQKIRLGSNPSRRKGHRLQRITLKFNKESDEKITREAEKYGTTKTQYVNMMIEFYIQQQ